MLTCPHCGYAGGPGYRIRQGFSYAERVWNYWDVRVREGGLDLLSDTFNPDLEQTPSERLIECGNCGEFFGLPEGLEIDWV